MSQMCHTDIATEKIVFMYHASVKQQCLQQFAEAEVSLTCLSYVVTRVLHGPDF